MPVVLTTFGVIGDRGVARSPSGLARLPEGRGTVAGLGSGTAVGWSHEAFPVVGVVVQSMGCGANCLLSPFSLFLVV